jgi:transposase
MATKIWAGLDIGAETTSICVMNDAGETMQETTCPTSLKIIHEEIRWLRRRRFARVGLEASSSLSLIRGLRSLGYSVDIYETRQLSKFLRVRRNKTDADDAIGIAEAGRIGASLVSRIHLKSLECQSLQSRLTIRRFLIRQRVALLNLLCRQIELYGGRINKPTRSRQLHRVVQAELRRLFGKTSTPLSCEMDQLVDNWERLRVYQLAVDRDLIRTANGNEVCRRFMEIPGVGPICALTFYAAVAEPHRFSRSGDIGSYLGLAPRLHRSGLTTSPGRISKMGNKAARVLLITASTSFMKWSSPDAPLRVWSRQVEQRCGRAKARVALARKLAIVMLAIWKKGERYDSRPTFSSC